MFFTDTSLLQNADPGRDRLKKFHWDFSLLPVAYCLLSAVAAKRASSVIVS
jgi:hypothetical protein